MGAARLQCELCNRRLRQVNYWHKPLKLGANGTLWAGVQLLHEPPGSPGWLVKLDRKTGQILGYVPVTEKAGLHTVEDAGEGQPMTDIGNRVVWFKRRSFRSVQ